MPFLAELTVGMVVAVAIALVFLRSAS